MNHIYQNSMTKSEVTLILFHGTGGNEYDLLHYAKAIDPTANILSIRGNVEERGMNRYFKRLSEGVFDQVDLEYRTNELVMFLHQMSEKYGFSLSKSILIGYSNGANIIASMILSTNLLFDTAILHHPMVPFRDRITRNLHGNQIWVLAGTNDSMVPTSQTIELVELFSKQQATTRLAWFDYGHTLSNTEIMWVINQYQKEILGK